MACARHAQCIQVEEALGMLATESLLYGENKQAVRRRPSLTSPKVLVDRCTRVARSRSSHAAAMSASFSFSAGESSMTGVARRDGTLLELTERDVGREALVEEAMTEPAFRYQLQHHAVEQNQVHI
jgi:hypothetical protein